MHRYGGVQFNYNGKEIGHVHSNGLLDVLFSRQIKYDLMNQGLINDHHVFNNSGWISFYIKKEEDVAYAIDLLRMAYLKYSK
ncbi:MAG: luciferase family protein [Mucilaginibacter sp.]